MIDRGSYRVSKYNDPNLKESPPIIQALGDATDPFEAGVLAYKVIAVGTLSERGMFPKGEGGTSIFGERIPYMGHSICIDFLCVNPKDGDIAVRCLAEGERMSHEEYGFWEAAAQQPPVQKIIFAYATKMEQLEEHFVNRLIQLYKKVELLHIPVEEK